MNLRDILRILADVFGVFALFAIFYGLALIGHGLGL